MSSRLSSSMTASLSVRNFLPNPPGSWAGAAPNRI